MQRINRLFTRDERGSAVMVVALMLTVIAGFGALVLDIGQIVLVKHNLSNIADAAVLSAARLLPEEPTAAEDTAYSISSENGIGANRTDVAVSHNNHRIAVTLSDTVEFGFARIFGLTSQNISVTSEAAAGMVNAMRNIVPLGIQREDFLYGVSYTIKITPHTDGVEDLNGNYQAIALGGFGASLYEDNLKYGYQGIMRAGEIVSTEPGNMSGPTRTGLEYRLQQDPDITFEEATLRSSRLVLVPIIDSFDVSGRSEVRVVGFAAFFLENVTSGEIQGKFTRYVAEGEIDELSGSSFGLKSVQLVR